MDRIIKGLEYYKRLPYTLYVEPLKDSDGSNYWTAEYTELRGCKTDGESEADAVNNLNGLFDEYITMKLESSLAIPEPARTPTIVETVNIFLDHHREETQNTVSIFRPEIFSNHFEQIAA